MFALRPIIGLVGGVGAGKSSVAKLFGQAGCCVVDSDELVRVAYTHPAVKRAIVDHFGGDYLDQRGEVDRPALARLVFRQPEQRRFLEELIHPIVNKARVEIMDAGARDEATIAYVWDSPLLMETRLDRLCDTVVFVDAPEADRARRVLGRGWDAGELSRREKAQIALDIKRDRADHVLNNGDASPADAEAVAVVLKTIMDGVSPRQGCCGGGCGPAGCAVDSADATTDAGAPARCGCAEAARSAADHPAPDDATAG